MTFTPSANGHKGREHLWLLAVYDLGGFLQETKGHLPSLNFRRLLFPPGPNYSFFESKQRLPNGVSVKMPKYRERRKTK